MVSELMDYIRVARIARNHFDSTSQCKDGCERLQVLSEFWPDKWVNRLSTKSDASSSCLSRQ